MGLGYPPRRNTNRDIPPVVPGRAYRQDIWRWLRILLVAIFFLFDLLAAVFLFAPGLYPSSPPANPVPQVILVPTPTSGSTAEVAGAPSLTPATSATPTLRLTPPTTPTAIATASPSATLGASAAISKTTATDAPPNIYVTDLRAEQQLPRRNQDIYFDVTFLNTTGSTQALRWDVLVYRPGNLRQYFGQSLPIGKGDSIPPGSAQVRSFGPYRLSGNGPCEDIVLRVARMDNTSPAGFIDRPDGSPFMETITVCP